MKNAKLSLFFVAAAALFTHVAMAQDALPKTQPADASSVAQAVPEVVTAYKLYFGGKGDKKPVLEALAKRFEKNKEVLDSGKCKASTEKGDIKSGVATAYSCTSPNDKTDSFFRSLVAIIVPTTKKVPELSLRTFTYAVPAQGLVACVWSSECCLGSVALCKAFFVKQPCTVCPK